MRYVEYTISNLFKNIKTTCDNDSKIKTIYIPITVNLTVLLLE